MKLDIYSRKFAVKWSNAPSNAQMSVSFFHIFVTELQCEPETCIRAIWDKWDLNALSLRVIKYLWVSFLHPGVGGQTLDGVSFRAAQCALDNGEAVGMDHPAVPSQIWLTKEQVAKKMCDRHMSAYTVRITCLSWRSPKLRSNTSGWCCCRHQVTRGSRRHLELERTQLRKKANSDWAEVWRNARNRRIFEFPAWLTCSIFGSVSNSAVGGPPLLPDGVEPAGGQLRLDLQVEWAQEAPPDELQRPAVAPAWCQAWKLVNRFNILKRDQMERHAEI